MHWNNDRNKGECSNASTKMGPSTIYSTPGETGLGWGKSLVVGFQQHRADQVIPLCSY
jgi:hypothetical protein